MKLDYLLDYSGRGGEGCVIYSPSAHLLSTWVLTYYGPHLLWARLLIYRDKEDIKLPLENIVVVFTNLKLKYSKIAYISKNYREEKKKKKNPPNALHSA